MFVDLEVRNSGITICIINILYIMTDSFIQNELNLERKNKTKDASSKTKKNISRAWQQDKHINNKI